MMYSAILVPKLTQMSLHIITLSQTHPKISVFVVEEDTGSVKCPNKQCDDIDC